VDIAASKTAVLHHVILHMGSGGAAAMRGVGRALRGAVNRTVSRVVCSVDTLPINVNLATVFPAAYILQLQLHPKVAGGVFGPEDARLFFKNFMACSPALVEKVHFLQLDMRAVDDAGSTADAVADFLSRQAHTQPAHLASHPASHASCMARPTRLHTHSHACSFRVRETLVLHCLNEACVGPGYPASKSQSAGTRHSGGTLPTYARPRTAERVKAAFTTTAALLLRKRPCWFT
jgi:hypothetical protein